MARAVSIITYHYVRDLNHSRYPEIKGLPLKLFKEQLKYIRKHYQVITMEALIQSAKEGFDLPGNAVLLTFDDAYRDHFESVFPVLDELGIQGSFFPPGKAIQDHRVLDVNKIHFILASVEHKKLLIEEIYSLIDTHRTEYHLESNEYYYHTLAMKNRFDTEEVVFIKRLLQKHLPEKLRNTIVTHLFFKYVTKDEEVFSRELYMNVDQLQCMARHGMYVGSHGWDHCWLNTLSEDQQKEEVRRSLVFLETIGRDTSEWVMCYPHGAYNDSLITLLKTHGCRLALTTEVGIADLITDSPFTLPRLDTNDLPKDKDAEPNEWTLKIIKS